MVSNENLFGKFCFCSLRPIFSVDCESLQRLSLWLLYFFSFNNELNSAENVGNTASFRLRYKQ